jgi:hypothetical protein
MKDSSTSSISGSRAAPRNSQVSISAVELVAGAEAAPRAERRTTVTPRGYCRGGGGTSGFIVNDQARSMDERSPVRSA